MTQARFVQEGLSIDHTPALDVVGGDVVVVGSLVGIAKREIGATVLGAIALTGVYDRQHGRGKFVFDRL